MPLLDLHDRPIERDEIEDLKVGKAPGLDGTAPRLLKYVGK